MDEIHLYKLIIIKHFIAERPHKVQYCHYCGSTDLFFLAPLPDSLLSFYIFCPSFLDPTYTEPLSNLQFWLFIIFFIHLFFFK